MTRPLPSDPHAWFIRAAGRVWGPYPEDRLSDFVGEGRVAAETLVGPTAEGPFAPAAHQARLFRLFGGASPDVADRGEPVSAPVGEPQPDMAKAEPLLVLASLKSSRADVLESLIGAYGPFARIMPGLWLVRAKLGPAGLRNALTRRLQSEDRLMVMSAPMSHAAWFNLDSETDRTLRQLWMIGD
jgi:hypothetical protein